MPSPLAQRRRSRAAQLGIRPLRVADQARVNRSFVYDVMHDRSLNPSAEKLA